MLKKKIFIIVIVLIIMLIFIFARSSNVSKETIIKNVKLASIKNEDINLLTYEIKDWNSPDDIKLLIKVTTENGLEYIKEPEDSVISAQGNNELYLDYQIKVNEEKTFVIKEKEKEEKEETIIITEEDFLSLLTNQPSVSVSNITTTGYDLSYSLADKVKPYVDSVTYYLGESETDESPIENTTGVVTGLSDYTKKYVWAEVTYKYGSFSKKVKSENYQIVYTAHTHNDSCYVNNYSAIYTSNFMGVGASYKDTVCREKCIQCSYKTLYSKSIASYSSDANLEINNGSYATVNYHAIAGTGACYKEKCIDYDGDWTTSNAKVENKECPKCGRYYCSAVTTTSTIYRCRHKSVTSVLVCTKPLTGYVTSYNF